MSYCHLCGDWWFSWDTNSGFGGSSEKGDIGNAPVELPGFSPSLSKMLG